MLATLKLTPILRNIPHDSHALIEASAGTGKTRTIEHLVLDLIRRGACTIEQVLVMTFTEKATTELRERLRSMLDRAYRGEAADDLDGDEIEIDDTARERIYAALASFARAPIFTIHAFCRRVLADLAFESGTRFSLQVVAGRKAFHDSFRAELREHFAVDETYLALLERWLANEEVENLEQLLYEAHRNRYLMSGGPERNRQAAQDLADRFDAKSLQSDFDLIHHAGAHVAARQAIVGLAKALEANPPPGDLLARLGAFDFQPLLKPKGLGGTRIQQFLDEARPRTRQFLDACELVSAAASLEVRITDAFLPCIEERLDREKRDNGTLDYDDMLAWLWGALDGPSGAALVSALRNRYRYAIVDEFQDTDDLQWRILRRVFVEDAQPPYLYVIGDPKQAIYAFRGADVFTYLLARNELRKFGEPLHLEKNFRATPRMIEACNLILDQKAPEPFFSGEIIYDHPALPGRKELRALDAGGKPIAPVVLMRWMANKGYAARARQSIGRHIAATIRGILDGRGENRITIDDGGSSRAVEAESIFVLTRSTAESLEIGEYLREALVPFAFYKEEGLFQAGEAAYILDVLRAIGDPSDRSAHLKAWASPFFDVPFRELKRFGEIELDPSHPLYARLFEWKEFADAERFAELFESLLHRSGLVYRELFLADSDRKLTNYIHVFEILLQEAIARRLSLGGVIESLAAYVGGHAVPAGEDPNVQRLESERSAVQVMTIHKSKGLEADVVFLFGGSHRGNQKPPLAIYHHDFERTIALGKTAQELAHDRIEEEGADEDRRLLYVAISRARARLYLPMYHDDSTKTPLNGCYRYLNARLVALAESKPTPASFRDNFIVEEIHEQASATSHDAQVAQAIRNWLPPDNLLKDDSADQERRLRGLRFQRPPLVIRSYTSMQRYRPDQARFAIEPEDFKTDDAAPPAEVSDLPGGRNVGIFLHEVLEEIDFETVARTPDPRSTLKSTEIAELIDTAMRRHRVGDVRWRERTAEIVFNALRARIPIDGGTHIDGLCDCDNSREMEFLYPLPELSHPLLSNPRDGAWTVERGYLKGFVDLVFRDRERVFFADWKSDLLASYDGAAIAEHVKQHYELQESIYSIGVIRLLEITNEREYEDRFGGLLYIFLRGIRAGDPSGNGIYFRRPSWQEVVEFERSLIREKTAPAEAAR